jgi:hypothetical protein
MDAQILVGRLYHRAARLADDFPELREAARQFREED